VAFKAGKYESQFPLGNWVGDGRLKWYRSRGNGLPCENVQNRLCKNLMELLSF